MTEMRAPLFLSLLSAAIALPSATVPAAGMGARPTKAQLEACPAFAKFNWRKLEKMGALRVTPDPAWAERSHANHVSIRGPYPMPDLSRAETALSLTVGGGETQEHPTSTSSFVWREKGGQWQIDRVDYGYTWPISPPHPLSGIVTDEKWHEEQRRNHFRGPLAAYHVRQIEEALADPCLALQPDAPPNQMPQKGKPEAPCWGGTGTTIAIRQPSGIRLISDRCGRWAAGLLMNGVMYGRPDQGFVVREALKARLGREPGEGLALYEGKDPYPYVAAICGRLGPADAGAADRLIHSTHSYGGRLQVKLLIESDTSLQAGEFAEEWKLMGCDKAEGQPG